MLLLLLRYCRSLSLSLSLLTRHDVIHSNNLTWPLTFDLHHLWPSEPQLLQREGRGVWRFCGSLTVKVCVCVCLTLTLYSSQMGPTQPLLTSQPHDRVYMYVCFSLSSLIPLSSLSLSPPSSLSLSPPSSLSLSSFIPLSLLLHPSLSSLISLSLPLPPPSSLSRPVVYQDSEILMKTSVLCLSSDAPVTIEITECMCVCEKVCVCLFSLMLM